ncbi:HesA/MoeB/ThiF family protein [Cupriavidus plantarum]|uniref:HesA/MoeB/ThiF family protein n=2 Tax=Cupriavidus plantarum TaxID=942865 RepID=UPI0024B8251D|nr:ThiF family adenylyltransferase [Cupriavidus plantarum]
MVDELDSDADTAMYFLVKQEGQRKALIARDASAARRVGKGFETDDVVKGVFTCFVFESANAPGVPEEGLPTTIKEFFAWVRAWDADLSTQIQHRLGADRSYLEREGCVIAFNTPIGRFGVMFWLDTKHRLGFRLAPKRFRNYLHNAGAGTNVVRLRLDDISPAYIHSRNLEYPSLTGKGLTLIGCGAIGGYLAQALVRLGAGTGKNGVLRLIDFGRLEPDNLGRHALGFPALHQNKAEALKDDLLRQFPYVNVEVETTSPRLNDAFFSTDLVIDATGEEALSTLVNAAHMKHRLGPMLYVWVKGNGECVQGLWSDSDKYGCFQCLRHGIGPNYRQERFQILDSPPRKQFRGCSSYTPYAVSAPMSAAALAADMVSDWLKHEVSPRFRTRYLETADAKRIRNQDIAPTTNCPACQHR